MTLLKTRRQREKMTPDGVQMTKLLCDKVIKILEPEFKKKKTELYNELSKELNEIQSLLVETKKTTLSEVDKKGEENKKKIQDTLSKIEKIKDRVEATFAEKMQEIESVEQKLTKSITEQRGPKGEPGKNGSPDTAKQVVDKVNHAKGVQISAITGLTEKFYELKRDIGQIAKGGGKKGGGMGDVKHQSMAVDSSTTSVQLLYTVAANGNAIWARYQGQMLVNGVDYTVSGKDVPLLFTPVDGTFIDITYVRG